MKHFTQFIHMLRSAWDGDRSTCIEQASELATRLEGEGDTAHARMLRFTLQALQSKAAATCATAATSSPRFIPAATAAAAPAVEAAPGQDAAVRVELTFGSWESEAEPH